VDFIVVPNECGMRRDGIDMRPEWARCYDGLQFCQGLERVAFCRKVWREYAHFLIPMSPRWMVAEDHSTQPKRAARATRMAGSKGHNKSRHATLASGIICFRIHDFGALAWSRAL
jgi:hypothetical protein